MSPTLRTQLLRLAAALGVLACASPARAQASPRFAAADALLTDSLARIGGRAVLAVVGPGGVRHLRAFGPVATADAVPIASATKWFSAAVVMTLVDRGEWSLQTPVSQHFPDAPNPVRTATVRQLFSHTAGVRLQPPCLTDARTTLAACAAEILALPLRARPGAEFAYGGGSMQLAAAMAERATGQTWAALFEARIAGPLGMTRTGYGRTANPWVGGGATASAPDYARFLQMLLLGGIAPPGTPAAGQRLLSQASVEAMLADQQAGAPVAFSPFARFAGIDPDLAAEPGYGVGIWRQQFDARGDLLRASSPGAFGFTPWIDVRTRTAGVLLVEGTGENVFPTALELERRVEAANAAFVTAEDGVAASPESSPEARIEAPRPNPAARGATFRVVLPAAGHVRVDVLDVRGRRVGGEVRGVIAAGEHDVALDVSALAAGVYVALLRVDGRVAGRQRLVVR